MVFDILGHLNWGMIPLSVLFARGAHLPKKLTLIIRFYQVINVLVAIR
jgi:hypothetical protein